MRRVFAPLRLQSDALHQPFVLGLHVEQGLRLRNRGDHRARLAAAERRQTLQVQIESAALDAAEHEGDFLGDQVVDVADEAQRQMIILRIDPARARQSAAQHAERLSDIGGNFDTGEETRHLRLPITIRARARTRRSVLRPSAGCAPRSRRRRRRSGAGHRPGSVWDRWPPRRGRMDKRRADESRQAPDKWHRRRAHSRRPKLRGARMPASRTAMCRSSSLVRMPSSAVLVSFGSSPRKASLAPSSTITASVPSGTDQSRRPSPPEAVSPDTPALVTLDGDAFGLERLRQPGREKRRPPAGRSRR